MLACTYAEAASFLTCKAVQSSVCSGLPNPETKFGDSNGKHILLIPSIQTSNFSCSWKGRFMLLVANFPLAVTQGGRNHFAAVLTLQLE